MSGKISVVINTYNAEAHLEQILEHVRGFDEIVVCDMESTDSTRAIAEKYGCRIVTFPKGAHKICEAARDFAIHSATNDWVLVVDADEIVPATLRDCLYRKISDENFCDAIAIPRINRLLGEEFNEKTDYQLRFFLKHNTVWPAVIHSHPIVESRIIKLPGKKEFSLLHLDDSSISARIGKMNTYTDYDKMRRVGRHFSKIGMIFRPAWFFAKSYFLQGGFRHGKRGIINAYLAAIYQMTLISKTIEQQYSQQI